MSTINRCPFCGHTASVLHDTDEEGDNCYWVECDNCGAIGPTADNEDEAVDNWNARRTDGFANWLDNEIEKFDQATRKHPYEGYSIMASVLKSARKQFWKLMDGLGVKETADHASKD